MDNRLFGDEVRCSVRFLTEKQKSKIAQARNALSRIAVTFRYGVTTMIRFPGILWQLVFPK